ncbi:MAG: TetR/AcrR family transcriptional regulator [Coriobacteriia bacterium]|nr:TetR/AcrR family transcriptional regulator [Coriobacteriia bacterium]
MPRPKNDKLKREILDAARASFRVRGYDATTYATVAEACGISRNLVQYHFPKKQQLAIGLMERLLEESRQALGIEEEELRGNLGAIYTIGVCYFEFLLQENAYRTFLADVTRNRDLTEEVLSFNGGWALEKMGREDSLNEANPQVTRAVIVQMGGFYELLYHCLQRGGDIDVPAELHLVMRAFSQALGYTDAQIAQDMPLSTANAERIAAAVSQVNRVLL